MSLVDLNLGYGFAAPESTEQLVADNPELADFLNNLNRPIGLIPAETASEYAVSADLSDEQREVLQSIGKIAALTAHEQARAYGVRVTGGLTAFGDRLVSRIGPTMDSFGHHRVENLIIADGRFVFAHRHVFRRIVRRDGILQIEGNLAPATATELDRFNVLHHRWQVRQQLNAYRA